MAVTGDKCRKMQFIENAITLYVLTLAILKYQKKAVFLNTPYLNRFSFLSHTLVDGVSVVSRFVISPVLEQDAGEIACEAANRFGRDQKHFFVSIEGINLGLIEYGMYFCLN